MTLNKRGRKIVDSNKIVSLASIRRCPKAPDHLKGNAITLWNEIVESLPTDFFRAGDLPLLEAYVISATHKRQLDEKLNAEGLMFDGEVHPALRISRDEATLMASLAVKLRLCQSSRTRPESANLKVTLSGNRPWEVTD